MSFNLLDNLMFLPPLILSLTVHEWAHAYSAFRLGDDTPVRQGRLTLNPVPHIDPIGTLLLPLLGIPFGWARPVQFNPVRFTRKLRMRTSTMITAAAGPFANVVLAVVCVVALALMLRYGVQSEGLIRLLDIGFRLNVLLAVFNMLPLRPLDGATVAAGVIPDRLQPAWERFAQYGPALLLVLIVVGSQTSLGLFTWPLGQATLLRNHVILAIAG